MIPRLKPYLDKQELKALFQHNPNAVTQFEKLFAEKFKAVNAVAFPYGRSALWAFFKALGIENAEVIQPAYTCSVVAHATVLSGNIPRFVDINLYDYNMNLEQVAEAITPNTRAIIATHLFGYPLDVNTLDEIVKQAEARYGHKIWVIQDCAHSFSASWKGKVVCTYGDTALFGLGISKTITSIFGGMLTFQDEKIAEQVRSWRDEHYRPASLAKNLRRALYLLAIYFAFNQHVYTITYWLQEKTTFLNYFTKAYHLDDKIHFPTDSITTLANVEANVGLVQLSKYDEIINNRSLNAQYYHKNLIEHSGWVKPPMIEGATYSHYVVRVPNRKKVLLAAAYKGIQLGQLIEYCISSLPSYLTYSEHKNFPNALLCSNHTINIPIYAQLSSDCQIESIINSLNSLTADYTV